MAAREMKMEDINQRQLLTEPHFQQMLEVLSDSAKDTEQHDGESKKWHDIFCSTLQMLLREVVQAKDIHGAKNNLAKVYEWFQEKQEEARQNKGYSLLGQDKVGRFGVASPTERGGGMHTAKAQAWHEAEGSPVAKTHTFTNVDLTRSGGATSVIQSRPMTAAAPATKGLGLDNDQGEPKEPISEKLKLYKRRDLVDAHNKRQGITPKAVPRPATQGATRDKPNGMMHNSLREEYLPHRKHQDLLEKHWIHKRLEESEQKIIDDEFGSVMTTWTQARSRVNEEVSRRQESLAFSSQTGSAGSNQPKLADWFIPDRNDGDDRTQLEDDPLMDELLSETVMDSRHLGDVADSRMMAGGSRPGSADWRLTGGMNGTRPSTAKPPKGHLGGVKASLKSEGGRGMTMSFTTSTENLHGGAAGTFLSPYRHVTKPPVGSSSLPRVEGKWETSNGKVQYKVAKTAFMAPHPETLTRRIDKDPPPPEPVKVKEAAPEPKGKKKKGKKKKAAAVVDKNKYEPIKEPFYEPSAFRVQQLDEVDRIKEAFARQKRPCQMAVIEKALLIPEDRPYEECVKGLQVLCHIGGQGLLANPFAPEGGKKKKKKKKK